MQNELTKTLLEKFNRVLNMTSRAHHAKLMPLVHRGQGRILALLSKQPSISQRELGFILAMRPQSLSELLSKMEKRELITRVTDQNDRRAMSVMLTDKGKSVAEGMASGEQISPIFQGMTEDELKALDSLLDKILANLEALGIGERDIDVHIHRFDKGSHRHKRRIVINGQEILPDQLRGLGDKIRDSLIGAGIVSECDDSEECDDDFGYGQRRRVKVVKVTRDDEDFECDDDDDDEDDCDCGCGQRRRLKVVKVTRDEEDVDCDDDDDDHSGISINTDGDIPVISIDGEVYEWDGDPSQPIVVKSKRIGKKHVVTVNGKVVAKKK